MAFSSFGCVVLLAICISFVHSQTPDYDPEMMKYLNNRVKRLDDPLSFRLDGIADFVYETLLETRDNVDEVLKSGRSEDEMIYEMIPKVFVPFIEGITDIKFKPEFIPIMKRIYETVVKQG